MIADSPYRDQGLVLTVSMGACAGLAAAGAALLLIVILQPLSGISHTEMLTQMGNVLLPASAPGPADSVRIAIGVVLHMSVGVLLGVLYAACQQDVPTKGLISVGVFYGFVLCLAGRFFVSPFVGEGLRATIRSWSWLLACLMYGIGLAAAAAWARRRHLTGDDGAVPVD